MERVAKASASSYNFSERPSAVDEAPQAPVGSNHQRIIPEKELPKMSERENFWNQEQKREKQRVDEERQRRASEVKLLEEERIKREEKEAKRREVGSSLIFCTYIRV